MIWDVCCGVFLLWFGSRASCAGVLLRNGKKIPALGDLLSPMVFRYYDLMRNLVVF